MAPTTSAMAIRPFVCSACTRQRLAHHARRPFATSTSRRANDTSSTTNKTTEQDPVLKSLSQNLQNSRSRPTRQPSYQTGSSQMSYTEIMDSPQSLITDAMGANLDAYSKNRQRPHRLHIYAHKHNTHITLVQPQKSAAETMTGRLTGAKVTAAEQKRQVDTLISMSTGNIGFRKSNRSSYDAAFQLAAFVLKQMEERGIWRGVDKLEVVLRGFGAGREAVTKAIMGSEGRNARPKISAVVDATRLKQGGPRSKKPRRLG